MRSLRWILILIKRGDLDTKRHTQREDDVMTQGEDGHGIGVTHL